MKAICTKTDLGLNIIGIKVGTEVDVTKEENSNYFDISFNGHTIPIISHCFFWRFKVTEGNLKMHYSDFDYILTNYVFGSAVLFPNEYSGIRHLVIQDWHDYTVMITINKGEDAIRVSYPNCQAYYKSYEEAIEGIMIKAGKVIN